MCWMASQNLWPCESLNLVVSWQVAEPLTNFSNYSFVKLWLASRPSPIPHPTGKGAISEN